MEVIQENSTAGVGNHTAIRVASVRNPTFDSTEVCSDLGFGPGSYPYIQCNRCVEKLDACINSTSVLFTAMVTLALLSLLPCFFCCCFGKEDQDSLSSYMYDSRKNVNGHRA